MTGQPVIRKIINNGSPFHTRSWNIIFAFCCLKIQYMDKSMWTPGHNNHMCLLNIPLQIYFTLYPAIITQIL